MQLTSPGRRSTDDPAPPVERAAPPRPEGAFGNDAWPVARLARLLVTSHPRTVSVAAETIGLRGGRRVVAEALVRSAARCSTTPVLQALRNVRDEPAPSGGYSMLAEWSDEWRTAAGTAPPGVAGLVACVAELATSMGQGEPRLAPTALHWSCPLDGAPLVEQPGAHTSRGGPVVRCPACWDFYRWDDRGHLVLAGHVIEYEG